MSSPVFPTVLEKARKVPATLWSDEDRKVHDRQDSLSIAAPFHRPAGTRLHHLSIGRTPRASFQRGGSGDTEIAEITK